MLDDYKYSIGRLVVYRHPDPKLPRQSYGQHGSEKTIGEVIAVDVSRTPRTQWVYTIQNARNAEITHVAEDQIEFATTAGKRWKKAPRRLMEQKIEDGALAEMIAKALSNPDRQSLLRSTLREFMAKEEIETRAYMDGPNLPIRVGDYIRVRGDLRKEVEALHNNYAKVLSAEKSDIAGIENPLAKPGQPRLYRTLMRYRVRSADGVEDEIYDAEVKLFYTANGRKTILNWRAATLLAEAFGDEPPYKLEFEYLVDHIFTREELKAKPRTELAQILASMMYVKGRLGWRDYLRRNQFFGGMPKSHLIDNILEISRFDSRRNRLMTSEEITGRQKEAYKLRRLLKSR